MDCLWISVLHSARGEWTAYGFLSCTQQRENELLMDFCTVFSKGRMNCLWIPILGSARREWTAYVFPYCAQQRENALLTAFCTVFSKKRMNCLWISVLCSAKKNELLMDFCTVFSKGRMNCLPWATAAWAAVEVPVPVRLAPPDCWFCAAMASTSSCVMIFTFSGFVHTASRVREW